MLRFLGLALAGLLVAGNAFAQNDGSFGSIQAIKKHTSGVHDGWRTVTFVDGALVQDLPGFGPATVNQYFLCEDMRYRAVCPNPEAMAAELGTLTAFFQSPGEEVYVDNVLYKPRTAPWTDTVRITTCYGDSSPVLWGGAIKYYRVTHWSSEFGWTHHIDRGCTGI
ncbi:hypothetical protein WME89_51195 [Sorangium sp. So ce321]|uniref:hypothetical protein n=1 Tax=Sorangium sp. So ce321 TaxID=3133300 RepID=UPI003F5DDBD7